MSYLSFFLNYNYMLFRLEFSTAAQVVKHGLKEDTKLFIKYPQNADLSVLLLARLVVVSAVNSLVFF